MMVLHPCPGLHCDEDQPKIVGLEEKLGIEARLPWLVRCESGEFTGQVKK
jgi:hypothetical protein